MNSCISSGLPPKLSLGPVTYYWDKKTLIDFYARIADTKIDIVYLGETVCAKRKLMRREDWLNVAKLLHNAGKDVVLCSMVLIEASSDLAALNTLCSNNDFIIEANDMSAVQLLSGQPFICGTAINIYNPRSLQVLTRLGMKRWVVPIELSKQSLADMQKEKPAHLETEVLVYGRLPLAYSARCFTARAHNLAKDNCQYRCLDYPDGLMLSTREKEKFLTLNGIQTQSAKTSNLIISPPSMHCEKIIDLFYQCLQNDYPTDSANTELESLMPAGGSCNGYWHGTSGMELSITGEKPCQSVQQ